MSYHLILQNSFWIFGFWIFDVERKKQFTIRGYWRWLFYLLSNRINSIYGTDEFTSNDNPNCTVPTNDEGDIDFIDIDSYIIWITWFAWFMGGLFWLGLLKGIFGLFIQRIGTWGMDQIIPHPHLLCEYREKHLHDRCVVHDDTGWPIHPDTFQKTVRVLSPPVEFLMNIIFFIAFPLIHLIKFLWWIGHCSCCRKQETQECCCEWVNSNCCECNAETKHLLRRNKSKTSNSSSASKSKQKNGKKTVRKQKIPECSESDSQPTSYDETNMGQENEDTRYVLNELNKSRLTLDNPTGKFSILNERCDQHCPNSDQQ